MTSWGENTQEMVPAASGADLDQIARHVGALRGRPWTARAGRSTGRPLGGRPGPNANMTWTSRSCSQMGHSVSVSRPRFFATRSSSGWASQTSGRPSRPRRYSFTIDSRISRYSMRPEARTVRRLPNSTADRSGRSTSQPGYRPATAGPTAAPAGRRASRFRHTSQNTKVDGANSSTSTPSGPPPKNGTRRGPDPRARARR